MQNLTQNIAADNFAELIFPYLTEKEALNLAKSSKEMLNMLLPHIETSCMKPDVYALKYLAWDPNSAENALEAYNDAKNVARQLLCQFRPQTLSKSVIQANTLKSYQYFNFYSLQVVSEMVNYCFDITYIKKKNRVVPEVYYKICFEENGESCG